ncbi:caspase domain-containing protein [Lactarius sanguifluus]|nr:caspase domain-containing protein [Lactarius sanguifluus]
MTNTTGTIRLPDDEEDKSEGPTSKRRALLVGISYKGDHNTWSALDGPHEDVDRFQQLLTETYGYRLEDITVLKDSPNLPDISNPTRVNMIRELKRLVSDAAPGDTFVFLYSGHSDQKLAIEDSEEEDSQDEMIITSDEQFILDNELNDILILLPIGCSLLAILDTCHSGTLLDLPHHHCNSVYVPWQSKGTRRTLTMQNNNALSICLLGLAACMGGPERLTHHGHVQISEFVHSIGGCLTLIRHCPSETHSQPSYRELMSHINFQLHDNALELHKYTRYQKKQASRGKGDGFDGELDNFQEPVLSSLARLVRVHHTNDLACC